jgi:hypothetical protein
VGTRMDRGDCVGVGSIARAGCEQHEHLDVCEIVHRDKTMSSKTS